MCHVEENGGQLGRPVARPVAKIAAAIGLQQESNPLENFVQGFLHRVAALHFFNEFKYELGLLDGGYIPVGGWIFDLNLVVERRCNHLWLNLLVVVLFGDLRIVVEKLLHRVFVCHCVWVWGSCSFGRSAKMMSSEDEDEGGGGLG